MNNDRPNPTWRKPAGMLAILAFIGFWCWLIADNSERISTLPFALQMFVYLIAGIAWILPLRPLLIWMETGSFRAPR